MLARYVVVDLVRNPRRTLSAVVGVTLGVGLFCGVLFFVDGLSASMTARAVAPLPIDVQRIVTERVGGVATLTQHLDRSGPLAQGERLGVELVVSNPTDLAAHEVTVRSVPAAGLAFVDGSARLDGVAISDVPDNPFAHGPGRIGYNVGTVDPGTVRRIDFALEAEQPFDQVDAVVASSWSSRESTAPVPADVPASVPLEDLAVRIGQVAGVANAEPLSLADLGPDALSAGDRVATGRTKIFGFDAGYSAMDPTIDIVTGALDQRGVVISAEAAQALDIDVGGSVTIALPDDTSVEATVTGVADLSRARSLFSSRRGGDLETFLYAPSSVVVPPSVFADVVLPAFERVATSRGDRLKNPPIREVDIVLDRALLHADPATALIQTQRVADDVAAVAAHQDYLLDNISNTLAVAAGDAAVAKQLFVFLGLPGLILAALLAAYAGTVLAEAQRREQATLRIRGASRRHLLRMLAVRTALLTAAGSLTGLAIGYLASVLILGQDALERAGPAALLVSATLGVMGGFISTGIALYATGRRSIDREIDEDRARLAVRPPLWRRARLDIVGVAVVVGGTVIAVRGQAFDGIPGSVYVGRTVTLGIGLLVLPISVWLAGSLLGARLIAVVLERSRPTVTVPIGNPVTALYRLSVGRRPWAIANGAAIVAMIVALAVCLEAFTASYDAAKARDARYATGSDLRVTPTPIARRAYGVQDSALFETDGVATATPVIYGVSNVILRSVRTSDPGNLAAVDPLGYSAVAPVVDEDFGAGGATSALGILRDDPTAVLLNADMADFLKAEVGDTLHVLLARATPDQVEVPLHIAGLFDRLPGFPDGADALMSIDAHRAAIPSRDPDFFLVAARTPDDPMLALAQTSLLAGPVGEDALFLETRATTLSKDQSSLAALNLAGLAGLDSGFALAMATVAVGIFVFGLLLQRRREYVTLRAQGLPARSVAVVIAAEAATVAVGGAVVGLVVGGAMGAYFVAVLRPLFVLDPGYTVPSTVLLPVSLVIAATVVAVAAGAIIVGRLQPTELLRDE